MKHTADLCIFTVTSVNKCYNLYNSPVYSCFLDATKAYDTVVTHVYSRKEKRKRKEQRQQYTYKLK